MAAVVSRVKNQTLLLAVIDSCGDAGAPDGQVGSAFQAFYGHHLGFFGKAECFPCPTFGWRVNETADQEVCALMRGPEQLKAGDGGSFAQFFAIGDQAFGDSEVIGLMHQREAVGIQPVLHCCNGESAQFHTSFSKQIDGGHAVFDWHPIPALEHHGLT